MVLFLCYGFCRDFRKPILCQDFRLYTVVEEGDSTICNDKNLQSGSTTAYVRSCQRFLRRTAFHEGSDWPTVIMGLSNLVDGESAPNVPIKVSDTEGNCINTRTDEGERKQHAC